MLSDRDAYWMKDILKTIDRVIEFSQGLDAMTFQTDEKTVYAVLYGLLTISEAARRLSEETRNETPEIPWLDIIAAGNVYRHEYHSLNREMIWNTVTDKLPPLKKALSKFQP